MAAIHANVLLYQVLFVWRPSVQIILLWFIFTCHLCRQVPHFINVSEKTPQNKVQQPNFADFSHFREEVSIKSDRLHSFVSVGVCECSEQQRKLSLRKGKFPPRLSAFSTFPRFSTFHLRCCTVNVSLRSCVSNILTSISRRRQTQRLRQRRTSNSASLNIPGIYFWLTGHVAHLVSFSLSFICLSWHDIFVSCIHSTC